MIKCIQNKTWMRPIASVLMAGILLFSPMAVMAASVPAAAVTDGLVASDIIDQNKKGSLTIHKYDITAAQAAGDYTQGQYRAVGEADIRVEEKLADYAVEGVQFTYLQVGNVEQYEKSNTEDNSDVFVVYEIPEKLREILLLQADDAVDMTEQGVASPCTKAGVSHYTSTQLEDALQNLLSGDRISAKNALEDYLENCRIPEGDYAEGLWHKAADMPETDAHGVTSVDNLSLGLYLVAETKVPEQVTETVDPWFVSLPFTNLTADGEGSASGGDHWLYDMVCYPKNQSGNPTLNKSVRRVDAGAGLSAYGDTATASGGDVLEYILVSKLPHITSAATYIREYTFTDQLSTGLVYNQDTRIALYETKEAADNNLLAQAKEIWTLREGADGAAYASVTVQGDAKTDGQRMTVQITESGLSRINQNSDAHIVVQYTVTVQSDATVTLGDEGNANDAGLLWRRTNSMYSNSLQDRNYVYIYGLDVTKTFSDDRGDASNVSFLLYNSTDQVYMKAKQEGDGLYYVTGKAESKAGAAGFHPASANGKLEIRGLEADTYQLVEAATDDGYMLLREPVEIEIRATDREVIASVAGTTGLDENAAENIVKNYGAGIRNENGELVTEGESAFENDLPVSGPNKELPNGRTIGLTDMYVGTIQNASAFVDGVQAKMEGSTVALGTTVSQNAMVVMQIVNHKGFLLPQTGGNGLFMITILGIALAGAGCYQMIVRSRKKNES